ncbi:MAG: tRNA (adenosine(37)-N6)-dimethylallyltransferase MiaA [Selenomonadaceae bacterium]|nr:tRNA (adenosine(37)-N6)-dimethylallyltransferase MiaA [Selenomonadaceae bacterium]
MSGYKEKLIVIAGPTASGKTALAVELARRLDTEIISGDSMLVYKGLDIGTAKPGKKEMGGIRHHLIDILDAGAGFNVTDFINLAKPVITLLNQQGRIPILAGGTGLYIKSLVEGYQFNETSGDPEYRESLQRLAEEKGREYVFDMLRKVNPDAAEKLHINNFRRIIRALEVYHLGGEQISEEKASELAYDVFAIGLGWERSVLYERINRRVEIMIEQGLYNEVEGLLKNGISDSCQSMKGIGYKELLPAVRGEISLDEAADKIKQNTRHFAKRQLTWYRKMPYIRWYDAQAEADEKLADKIYHDMAGYYGLL